MKIRIVGVLVGLALMGFSGCAKETPSYSATSGSLGLSRDDALLYAADADSNQLLVIDTKTDQVLARVPVGKTPEKVLVGLDDTIYVTNAFGRSVSVIRRGDWTQATTLSVGVEPRGLSLTPDGKTLLVVSATALDRADVGTLTAIDTGSLSTEWTIPVGEEPRGVAVLGERAFVSLSKQGDLVEVDLKSHSILKSGTGLLAALNKPSVSGSGNDKAPEPFPGTKSTVHPRGLDAIAVTPDGRQLIATGVLASDAVLNGGTTVSKCFDGECFEEPVAPPTGGGGSGYGGGSCGATAVAAPALLSFGADGAPQVDDLASCKVEPGDHPPSVLSTGRVDMPVQGPVAAVVDPSGTFVFVANRETDNVAVVPVSRGSVTGSGSGSSSGPTPGGFNTFGAGSVREVVMVGSGPTGLALSQDGKRAWTYNQFDHTISRLESRNGRLLSVATTKVADEVLSPAEAAGRRLFFSATDARMNNPGIGVSCNSCHPDTREDGHVWQFSEGPRQTPSLAGRMLVKTAPFHWGGEFPTLRDFMSHTVQRRMGGTGVTAAMEEQLKAYITIVPAPDQPYKLAEPSAQQLRGQAVFNKAACGTCHAGEALADGKNANVGTFTKNDKLPAGLNTPSILALARTAPYLHDGSAGSLKARILQGKEADLHGRTSQLTSEEIDDLVAYLQSL